MKHIVVKSAQAQPREYVGVRFELLATGSRSMVTKMLFETQNKVPVHRHPNEQSSYVISGRYQLKVGGQTYELAAGDSYSVQADTDHAIDVLEAGQTIDVFAPPREDFR